MTRQEGFRKYVRGQFSIARSGWMIPAAMLIGKNSEWL